MTLEIGTTSNAPIDVGNLVFDEQYTLRWIDRTEPKEEPKFDDPDKMQVRFRCEFEIVGQPEDLVNPETGELLDLRGQRVADFFTVSLHEKANFGQVVRAMLNMKPDEKFSDPRFDIDSLCAARNPSNNAGVFRATVRRKATGYPKIENPLPARRRAAPVAAADAAFDFSKVTVAAAPAAAPAATALGEPPF